MLTYFALLSSAVSSLKEQLAELKKKNQNSQISAEKNIHLQRQVGPWEKLYQTINLRTVTII